MIGRLPGPGLRQTGIIVIILFLCGLAACGGGGSYSQPPPPPPPPPGGGNAVGPFFFGMHINKPNSQFPSVTPSPDVPTSGVRLWDTQTSWATTNTSAGVYDWTNLDFRLKQAFSNKADVLYDFARTPAWAQCPKSNTACGSGNTSIVCAYATITGEGGDGQCFPPNDLNVDGSGTNQHWIDWVTAVATHSVNSGTAHISYYEVWNEPNIPQMWQGTPQQLVRMAGDARCIIIGDKGCNPTLSTYAHTGIDPAAKLLTPAYTNPVDNIATYLTTPLNGVAGVFGANLADIVAFHGYPGANPAEQVLNIFSKLSSILAGQALKTVPVFDTEGSWGASNGSPIITDPDQQAAFTARYLLVQESAGIQRLYWYGWDLDNGDGTLWTGSSLTLAGVAYQQTEHWVSGATLTAPGCTANGSVWTCAFTRSGGYQALAVWDASGTSTFTLPSSPAFTQYQDLAGNTHTVSPTVAIGAKPILLETGNIP